MYGLGVAAADYDNDGFTDLYVTVLDGDRLFRNRGDGTFEDVTRAARIDNARFGTSAAWLDFDLDGHLDLYVANYVQWSIENDLWCSMDGSTKTYCTPESYQGQPSVLYRNRGDGTFEDVSARAGVDDPTAKALGIVVFDYDSDGLPDHIPGQRHPAEQALSGTGATAPSANTGSRPGSRTPRMARRAVRWGWTRPITTAADASTCWWGTLRTRW